MVMNHIVKLDVHRTRAIDSVWTDPIQTDNSSGATVMTEGGVVVGGLIPEVGCQASWVLIVRLVSSVQPSQRLDHHPRADLAWLRTSVAEVKE